MDSGYRDFSDTGNIDQSAPRVKNKEKQGIISKDDINKLKEVLKSDPKSLWKYLQKKGISKAQK